MRKMFHFKSDGSDNPYSQIFETFFKRQNLIKSNITIINYTKLQGFRIDAIDFLVDTNSDWIQNEELFSFDATKGEGEAEYEQLKKYLFLSLVAQSFENLEAFLKQMLSCYLSAHIPQPDIVKILKNSFRNNDEVLKALKRIAPNIETEFVKYDRNKWFDFIQKIRHCVVHTDQKISKQVIHDNAKIFNQYFVVDNNSSLNPRVFIAEHSATNLISHISTYGFAVYRNISNELSKPLGLTQFENP